MTRSPECAAARRAMLTAEPEELRGRGDGPLAAHLGMCPACTAAARDVLAATDSLDAWLAAPGPAPRVERLLGRAEADDAPRRPTGSAAGARASRRVAPWLGLTAAAALAAVLIRAPTPPEPVRATAAEPEALPIVQDAGGRSVAILGTRDPNITLVWFF